MKFKKYKILSIIFLFILLIFLFFNNNITNENKLINNYLKIDNKNCIGKEIILKKFSVKLCIPNNYLYQTIYGDFRDIKNNIIQGEINGLGTKDSNLLEIITISDFNENLYNLSKIKVFYNDGKKKFFKISSNYYLLFNNSFVIKFNPNNLKHLRIIKSIKVIK